MLILVDHEVDVFLDDANASRTHQTMKENINLPMFIQNFIQMVHGCMEVHSTAMVGDKISNNQQMFNIRNIK